MDVVGMGLAMKPGLLRTMAVTAFGCFLVAVLAGCGGGRSSAKSDAPLRAPACEVKVWTGEKGHGGGDNVMLDDLFLLEKNRGQVSARRGPARRRLLGFNRRGSQPLDGERQECAD